MRKFLKYFFISVIFIFHLCLAAAINYSMPSYDVTKVTGVEVKRVDKDGPITKANPADGRPAMCILSIRNMKTAK